jgi:hypothetical protein
MDEAPPSSALQEQPLEVEASAQVEVDVVDVVSVRVTGGRRETQQIMHGLEERWINEVKPHLVAAKVTDLDGLDAKIEEARKFDTEIAKQEMEMTSLREQIQSLPNLDQMLRAAIDRKQTICATLSGVALDTVANDVGLLGIDPLSTLRQQQEEARRSLQEAREEVHQVSNAHAIGEERCRNLRAALDTAMAKFNIARQPFPQGLPVALAEAQKALAAADEEQQKVSNDLASLHESVVAERAKIEAAVSDARKNAETMDREVETARDKLDEAMTEHASQGGRLDELRRLRDDEDLAAAEQQLQIAIEHLAALPVPVQVVSEAEVSEARNLLARVKLDLQGIEREIQKTHGALEQVGGAVARERLRDTLEAFELSERQEKEIEADYEGWKLLLEQMKEADAAQASNLGQVLAPALAQKFEALTAKRYEGVRLNAQLGAEGIVAAGAVRPAAQISVGTREQLSTLYRLALAEYLHTVVVLDDQLVQSDGTRMDWFRGLLVEKARNFQIIVFTCRPEDYLSSSAVVSEGNAVHSDCDGGFIRGIDLGRVLQRR